MAAIAVGTVALQYAAPLDLVPASQSFIMSPGFTAFALLGGVLVAISPVLAIAFMIRTSRPSGRAEPESGE